MKTIITTIAAALFLTLSLNASAQETRSKQEPVKKETKSKASTAPQTETKSKTNTAPQTEPKTKANTNTQTSPQAQPAAGTTEAKGKSTTTTLPMNKRKGLKRATVKAPQKDSEAAPAKKID